jgi:hypothetical protein
MLTDTERMSFQDKFKRDYQLIAQQMTARLPSYCDSEPDAIDARYFYFNLIGKVAPRVKTTFAGPTPNMSPEHFRNQGTVVPYEWGDVFDEEQLRTLVADPQNKHKLAAVAGFYRQMDQIIINQALGNRVQYNAAGTTTNIPLPAAQKIAAGTTATPASRMTFDKVRETKAKLDKAEVDEGVPNPRRVFVHSADEISDLLAEAKATSSDYVGDLYALRDGKLTYWMGFDWVRSELLPITGTIRSCFAMATWGVGIYMNMTPNVETGKDPSASFAERLYLTQKLGATRNEDVRVVQVDVDRAPVP